MSTNDLATFLESIGLDDVVDYGDEIGARCLKHEERTGSEENVPRHWYLNVEKKTHHCFSCGYKGTLQSLVIDVCNGDAWRAAGLLQGYIEEEMFRSFEKKREKEAPHKMPPALGIVQFSWPTERALKNRGLTMATCKEFGIRWDPEDSSWILPIREPNPPHDLWGWQAKSGRFVRNRPHKVKKGQTLFGIERLRAGTPTMLVESPLDVAYVHQFGISAVASFGDRVTVEQIRLLLQRCPRLILALDNDKAGIRSMKEIVSSWGGRFVDGMVVLSYAHAPHSKDPGDMTAEEIQRAVAAADPIPFWEHYDVQRNAPRFPARGRGTNDRAQIIARRLSAGTGKNRDLNRRGRATDRRR